MSQQTYTPRFRAPPTYLMRNVRARGLQIDAVNAGCIDHLGAAMSLHDVQVRLDAFVDEHYHRAPHGGLYGKAPDVRHDTRADRGLA